MTKQTKQPKSAKRSPLPYTDDAANRALAQLLIRLAAKEEAAKSIRGKTLFTKDNRLVRPIQIKVNNNETYVEGLVAFMPHEGSRTQNKCHVQTFRLDSLRKVA